MIYGYGNATHCSWERFPPCRTSAGVSKMLRFEPTRCFAMLLRRDSRRVISLRTRSTASVAGLTNQPPALLRRRAGCRSRCLREGGAPAGGAVKGPNDSARSNDSGTRTAPEVRDTPKKLTATPHEMTTHVMEPGASSCAVMVRSTGFLIFRQQGRAHLNVIEQSHFAGLAPRAIEAFKLLRALR